MNLAISNRVGLSSNTFKFSLNDHNDIGVVSEALWMIYNESDSSEIPKILETANKMAPHQYKLINYISNCNKDTKIENKTMDQNIEDYVGALENLDLTNYLKEKMKLMLSEYVTKICCLYFCR